MTGIKGKLKLSAGVTALALVLASQAKAQTYGLDTSGADATVVNPVGTTITGSTSGIYADGGTLTVDNAGTIRGNGTLDDNSAPPGGGITIASPAAQITNSGTISGAGYGITTAHHYDPASSSLIGLAIGTSVTNSGTITGDNNDGVRLIGGGTVTNSGTIAGVNANPSGSTDGVSMFAFADQNMTGQTSIGTVSNLTGGSISGQRFGVILSAGGTITNAGDITGGAGGAVIQAVAPGFAAHVDNSGTMSGADGVDFFGLLDSASLTNSAVITGTSGYGVSVQTDAGSLDLTNTAAGTITGSTSGIYADGGTLTVDNAGTITGAQKGVFANGAALNLTNTGTIRGEGTLVFGNRPADAGVTVSQPNGTIVNSGTISGAGFGIVTQAYFNPATGLLEQRAANTLVTNSGTIRGDNNDAIVLFGGGSVENSGTIEGIAGAGTDGITIQAFSGANTSGSSMLGSVVNHAGGTISGARYGALVVSGGSIDNAGTITGGTLGVVIGKQNTPGKEASLLNSGTINGGALLDVDNSVVDNSGTIVNGAGIALQSIGNTSLTNSGLINGANSGLSLTGNSDPSLITAQINNSGVISSAQGAALVSEVQTSLVNSGSLEGGAGISGTLSIYNDEVTLLAGSHITGTLQGGAGTDLITLDASADPSVIQQLPTLDGFEQLTVSNGAWANSGVVGSINTVSISQGAALQLYDVSLPDGTTAAPLAAGEIVDNGKLILTFGNSGSLSQIGQTLITGTGSVTLDGTGVLELADASGFQYTGGTTVAGGALLLTGTYGGDITTEASGVFQIGDGGTTGDFTGNLVDNGIFIFNRSDDYQLTGAFSGTGTFVKFGGGKLTLGADYTFAGMTIVNAGSIGFAGQNQTIGGLTGSTSSAVDVTDAVLTIVQSQDSAFAGSISGSGSLVKSGSGILRLDGTNTYTGTTTIIDGKLSVNGSIVSQVFVESGATLGGNGTVSDVTVDNGGTIGAGNSIGRLTVAGDLNFAAGSTLQVEVNPLGAADRIDVTGAITIASAASVQVLAETGTYLPVSRYTILTATNGISGTFGSVTTNMAFLTPLLTYSSDAVALSLYRNDISFAAVAQNENQAGVAQAVQARGIGDPIFESVVVRDAATARSIYSSLSGELYATALSSITRSSSSLRDEMADIFAGRSEGSFLFGSALTAWGDGSAINGASSAHSANRGIIAGLGYAANGLTAGFGAGFMYSDTSLQSRPAAADVDSTYVVAQLGYAADGFHAQLGGAYSWHRLNANRLIDYGTGSVSLTGATHGHTGQIFADIGYDFDVSSATLTPFAKLAHVQSRLNDFDEIGGTAALAVKASQTVDLLTLGVMAKAGLGPFRPHVSLGWQHSWGDLGTATSVAFADGGSAFGIYGAQISPDAATIDSGISIGTGRLNLDLGYRAVISKDWNAQIAKVSLTLAF